MGRSRKTDGSEEDNPNKALMSSPGQIPRNQCPSICAICGKKASGYHYEVASCNGCKTFYRRTVLSQKRFKCNENSTCIMDLPLELRTLCRACRFERCVEAGMNPCGIRTGNLDRNSVVISIEERRSSGTLDKPSTSKERNPNSSQHSPGPEVEELIDRLLVLDLRERENFSGNGGCSSLRQYLLGREGINQEPGEGDTHLYEMLQHMFAPYRRLGKTWTVADLLATVDYVKRLHFFSLLSEEDQVKLVKRGTLLCFNLSQAFLCYRQPATSEFSTPNNAVVFSFMSTGRDYRPSSPVEQRQLIDAIVRLQMNKKEFVLLKALVLCNSGIEDLSERGQDVLEEQREKLSHALCRLCLDTDPARYPAILGVVDSLYSATQQQKSLLTLMSINHSPSSYGILEELVE